jgi:hypothetical protein
MDDDHILALAAQAAFHVNPDARKQDRKRILDNAAIALADSIRAARAISVPTPDPERKGVGRGSLRKVCLVCRVELIVL